MKIQFGEFHFDADRRSLRSATGEEVELRRQCLALLSILARSVGSVVSKEELSAQLWPDTAVEPNSLNYLIWDLRRTLAACGAEGVIETVGRRGYRLRGTHAATEPAPAALPPASAAPFEVIGRAAEMRQLHAAYDRAAAGQRAIVVLTGEAGIGKSFLMASFLADLSKSGRPAFMAVARCLRRRGSPEPYGVLLEALESLAADPQVVVILRRIAPTWLVQLTGVIEPEECAALRQSLTGSGSARMIREGVRLFEELARDHPFVVALEDVQWADAGTLDILEALAARSEATRLMVLSTLRTYELNEDEAEARERVSRLAWRSPVVTRIDLQPLSRSAIGQLVDAIFKVPADAVDLTAALELISGGNPLFLVGLTSYLAETGLVAIRDGHWSLQVALDALATELPSTVRGIISEQLDLLPTADIATIEAASVAGVDFSVTELAAALDRDPVVVDHDCARLARGARFISDVGETRWPDGSVTNNYRFRHVLYRRAVYERVPPALRRKLHARIGERLAAGHHDQLDHVIPKLVEHFDLAGEPELLLIHQEKAAALSFARFAVRDSLHHVEAALRTIERLPPSPARRQREAARWLDRGNLAMIASGFGSFDVLASFDRAYAIARTTGDPELAVRAQLGRCLTLRMTGAITAAYDAAADLVERAENNAPSYRAAAYLYRAWVHAFHDIDVTLADLERALSFTAAMDQVSPILIDLGATILGWQTYALTLAARREEAQRAAESAWTRARSIAAPVAIVDVGVSTSLALVVADDPSGTRRIASETKSLAEDNGIDYQTRAIDLTILWARARDDRDSLAEFQAAVAASASTYMFQQAQFEVALADCLVDVGDLGGAAMWCDAAAQHHHPVFNAEVARVRGDLVLASGGSSADAAKYFEQAVEAATRTGATLLAQRATERLTR